jgi:hypothetical protein
VGPFGFLCRSSAGRSFLFAAHKIGVDGIDLIHAAVVAPDGAEYGCRVIAAEHTSASFQKLWCGGDIHFFYVLSAVGGF